jgi:hypothetical protein
MKNEMGGYITLMGERKGAYSVLVGKLMERDHLEDPAIDRRVVLKLIFKKLVGSMDWIDLAQDRDSSCVCGDEPSGSIKCKEFLD